MNLPEALRRQKDDFQKNVSTDIAALMDDATEKLSQSTILQDCLQPGERAPDFSLEDSSGTLFNLSKSLENGPVVLKFFRGDW